MEPPAGRRRERIIGGLHGADSRYEGKIGRHSHCTIDGIMSTNAGKGSGSSSDFYRRVYRVVARIPVGRVTTYGAIARCLGLRSSARMVGYALKAVAEEMALPCHRVVNRNGELTGKHHFATPTLMRDLLEGEQVKFKGDAVLLEEHFWDPCAEGNSRMTGRRKKGGGA